MFLKLHGVVRPLSLKTDVIKKRNRSGSATNNNTGLNNSEGIGRGLKKVNDLKKKEETTGGRSITFTPNWAASSGNEAINKRQRRHSLSSEEKKKTMTTKNTTSAAMVISGSLPNHQQGGDGLRQVLLSKQQQQRHNSFSGTGSSSSQDTVQQPKGARTILPNNHRLSLQHNSSSGPLVGSAPTVNWMGLMAQQQQRQQQQQQQLLFANAVNTTNTTATNSIMNNTTTPSTFPLLTPNQLQQLILLQATSVNNRTEDIMDHDHHQPL